MGLTASQRHRLVYELGFSARGVRDMEVICRNCTPRSADHVIDLIARRPAASASQVRRLTANDVTLPYTDAEIRACIGEGISDTVRAALNRITGRVQ
jgi:hypothetical protein